MSAEAHRAAAAQERADAERQMRLAQSSIATPQGLSDMPYSATLSPSKPPSYEAYAAERQLDHARAHEQAAAALEAFEDIQCRDIPARVRSGCPMVGPIARLENIRDGVRLELGPAAIPSEVVAFMRCHLAFAKARGFPVSMDCPLYIRGVEINLSPDGRAIEIRGRTAAIVEEIQRRAPAL